MLAGIQETALRVPILVLFALLFGGSAAQAGLPYPVKKSCAVGGERFTHTETMAYTVFGHRPDGKPYGSWTFPLPLPVCPGNGLVMYRDFSKTEKASLKALIASEEYRSLLAENDTPYYRAAWLERQLSPSSEDTPWILLQATWEADGQPERQARYDRAFIAAVDRAPSKPADLTWAALQARAANAERQLSEFEAAAGRLTLLDRGVTEPGQPPDPDAERRASWKTFITKLGAVIVRRDNSREPLDMLDEQLAAQMCEAAADRSQFRPIGFCESPAMLNAIKALNDVTEQQEEESQNP
jgi:hypothetical protein